MSANFELFRQAIAEMKQIVCSYDGYSREVCPHVIGYDPSGTEHALVFQFAGGSASGLPRGGEWRCLELWKVRNAQLRDGDWHTNYSHSKSQVCISRVVAEVRY